MCHHPVEAGHNPLVFLPAPTPPVAKPITLAAVGDVMLGSDYPSAAYLPPRGTDLLRPVAPLLREADLTFGNLEGPLTTGGATGKRGPRSFAFRSPPANAARLAAAGFDVLSTANNHASDFGPAGRASTRAALAQYRMTPVGNRGEIALRTVRGTKIAFVAFAFNRVSDNVNDLGAARALVARAGAGGALVVVSVHWGAEGTGALRVPKGPETYLGESRGDPRRFAHAVVDAGADLVLGHGPHVPRALELYRGRLVAHSLGNFATYGLFGLRGACGEAPVLTARLDPRDGRFLGGRIASCRQTGRGGPRPDPSGAAAREIARLTRLDFPAAGVRVGAGGQLSTPAGRPSPAASPRPR